MVLLDEDIFNPDLKSVSYTQFEMIVLILVISPSSNSVLRLR